MTFISTVKFIQPEVHRHFVAERLLALKDQLRRDIHARSSERALRLATWNIMHFSDGGGYQRSTESLLYIAEILDHFDLVAIQEVNHDLDQFELLMRRHMGPGWDYILTDASGNRERLAFIYRKAKVSFLREAGEIVLPEGQEIVAPETTNATRKLQFARTPFAVTFRAGWFRFKLATVHIFYGENGDNSPDMELRRREIEKVAQFLADIQKKDKRLNGTDANMILLGDFNIISPEHRTMEALKAAGFSVPAGMEAAGTNLEGNHHYDQIVMKLADKRIKFGSSGVFNINQSVFRNEDAAHYVDNADIERIKTKSDGTPRTRTQAMDYFLKTYRRNQLSDHKLLWCELTTDFSEQYLQQVAAGELPPGG
jgi:exonuclease III